MDADLVLHRVSEWAEARAKRLAAKRVLDAAGRCEEAAKGYDDDGGRAACYHFTSTQDDWCETCKRRDPLFQAMRALRPDEKAAMRRLKALVDRQSPALLRKDGSA